MSEAALQSAILELAKLLGWRCAHFRPAQTRTGRWLTPVSADGAGFPDLLMARGQVLIAAELKADKGRLTPAQTEWLDALSNVCDVYVWRPADWASGRIEQVLR